MRSDITPGQTSDYLGFDLVMDDNLPEPCVLLADRGYDSDKVRETMEAWWHQVKHASKRDQLSFNYSAWKTGLQYNPIELDIRNNPYMKITRHYAH